MKPGSVGSHHSGLDKSVGDIMDYELNLKDRLMAEGKGKHFSWARHCVYCFTHIHAVLTTILLNK